MTDDALGRRRADALASLDIIAPPPRTDVPATARQLLLGWPFVWGIPGADLTAWVRAQRSGRGLPAHVRRALDAVGTPDNRTSALAMAAAYDAAGADETQSHDRRAEFQECATRARLSAAFLGDRGMALAMSVEADVEAACCHDDAERRLLLTTGSELRYVAMLIERGVHEINVGRANMRRVAWDDLGATAEVVTFWLALDRSLAGEGLGERLLGGVRDDTGWDPDEPDDMAPPEKGRVVLPAIGQGLKPDAMKEIKAAVGRIVGMALPFTRVPMDWQMFVAALDAEFPHFSGVTHALAMSQSGRRHWGDLRHILVGPPGSGKTRYVRRLCEHAKLHLGRIACDASADNSSVAATPRRWQTGHPCRAIVEYVAGGTANPVILLDEIGRASGSQQSNGGRMFDALIGMTDPENARRYHDAFIDAEVDLSTVLWLGTANDVHAIPGALLDRFRVLAAPIPGPEHLVALARGLMADLRTERGSDESWMPDLLGDEISVVSHHWRGGSVRRLRVLIETVIASRDHLAPRH